LNLKSLFETSQYFSEPPNVFYKEEENQKDSSHSD